MSSSGDLDVEKARAKASAFEPGMDAKRKTMARRLTTLPLQMRSKSPMSAATMKNPPTGLQLTMGLMTMTCILRNTVVSGDTDGAARMIARLTVEKVEKSAGFTIQDVSGNGLLQIAALKNYIPMIKLLLEKGFDINAVDGNHGTALQAAIYMDHSSVVELLLHDDKLGNANFNTKGGYYGCALQVAAFKGSDILVKDLLSRGADVNISIGKYGSALQAAARTGLPSAVELILKAGFQNVNAEGGVYATALQAAAKGNYTGATKVLRRLSRGRVLKQETGVPRIAKSANTDYFKVTQMLLDRGAKVSICGGRHGSPINAAACSGQLSVLELLLEKDDTTGKHRKHIYGRALISAITQTNVSDSLPLVNALIEHGANIDHEVGGCVYSKPLTAAAAMNSEPVVKYLLAKAKDKSALMNAEGGIYGSALRAALSAPAKETSMYLIRQHADLTAGDHSYGNVLHLAAFSNLDEVVQLLLEEEYNVDINALDDYGQTALHIAAYLGFVRIVLTLLNSHAKPSVKDAWGDTPLSIVEEVMERESHPGPSLEDLRKIKQMLLEKSVKEIMQKPTGPYHGPSITVKPQLDKPERRKAKPVFASPKWNPGLDFEASIVDFLEKDREEYVLVKKLPIDDLLYRNGAIDEVMDLGKSSFTRNLRWIHLPANNMTWAEMLIKILWAQTYPDTAPKSFWGTDPYFVSPDLAPHARFITPQCERLIPDSGEPQSPLPLPNFQHLNTLFLAMPYIHWEAYRAQEAVSELLDRIKDDSLKTRILRAGRTWRTTEDANMPLRNRDVNETLHRATGFDENSLSGNLKTKDNDDVLLCKYLFKRWPIHLRRTLDQYYYSYLADTRTRDGDQVVMRIRNRELQKEAHVAEKYLNIIERADGVIPNKQNGGQVGKEKAKGPNQNKISGSAKVHTHHTHKDANSPIIMIDQLWIWVIRKDLIITSFPQRRLDREDGDLDPEDRTDVMKTILAYLHSAKRHPIHEAYDLCELIVSQCIGILHRSDMIPDLDFLKIFARQADWAVDAVMDGLSEFVVHYKEFMDWLNDQKHTDPGEYVERFEKIFSVTNETELLREIQDMKDELNMLAAVFADQQTVLKKAGMDIAQDRQKRPKTRSAAFNFEQQSQKHSRHIQRMHAQASQAYDNLKDLLDLKQQQANVLEARVSRNQAIASKEQGKTIMVFTIVTIIFLPLTFMTTVFTLPVLDFPRYDPADGTTPNPAGQLRGVYVFLIIVGVTMLLAIPLIITAFKVKRIQAVWEVLKAKRRKRFPLHFSGRRGLQLAAEDERPKWTWGPFYWGGPDPLVKRRGAGGDDL